MDFNRKQNLYAGVRDYLIASTINLTIATPNSIRLQASSLSQLTESTNQLTRSSAVRRATRRSFSIHVHLGNGRG